MINYHRNLKMLKPKNPTNLRDPLYRQRREPTKKLRLNKLIEQEAAREIRQAKKTP